MLHRPTCSVCFVVNKNHFAGAARYPVFVGTVFSELGVTLPIFRMNKRNPGYATGAAFVC